MLVRNLGFVLCANLLLVAAAGCEELLDEDEGNVPETEIPLERRGVIPLRQGFVDGKPLEFYQLGFFVPTEAAWFPSYEKFPGMPVREMYVWGDADGAPSFDSEQRPIVDTLPRQAQSSDFFELVVVRGATTAPNDIKSRGTLLRSGFTLERTGQVVNCPIVGEGSRLGGTPASRFRRLTLWYRKKTAYCTLLDGGPGAQAPLVFTTQITGERSELRVAAGEVYSLRSNAFTAADEVRGIGVPRNDIFRRAPGHREYTPLVKVWDVTVPSDYQVGQRKSYAELFPVPGFEDPAIVARSPETFCNCPIVGPR